MSYVVRASEKVRGIGAEYETKALLYLMNGREDSHEISCFAIDFFNDVTGLNQLADKAWDVQSKGNKSGGAKGIGRELVTLFKNYMSDLHFDYMILFLAAVPESFRLDDTQSVFGIENITPRSISGVRCGLIEEGTKKTYIENDWLTDENLDGFLKQITFVVDTKTKAEYIKKLIKVNPKYIPKDEVLDGIFNEIRDAQAAKKNNDSVEGEMVDKLGDVWAYDRVLWAKEIRLKVLNTFINDDIMNVGVPVYFIPIIQRYDGLRQKSVVEDCKLKISVALFDKANTDNFWNLLDLVSEKLVENPSLETNAIYDLISKNEVVHKSRLDLLSIKFLISVMKEALE